MWSNPAVSTPPPTPWLITGDKDKGKRGGGVVKTVMARMAKTVVVTAKRRGMVAMVGWGWRWGGEWQQWFRMAVCCGMAN